MEETARREAGWTENEANICKAVSWTSSKAATQEADTVATHRSNDGKLEAGQVEQSRIPAKMEDVGIHTCPLVESIPLMEHENDRRREDDPNAGGNKEPIAMRRIHRA